MSNVAKNIILFIFEGKQPETQILKNMEKLFFQKSKIVAVTYGAEIYQLYEEIADEAVDLIRILSERDLSNKEILGKYRTRDISQIFLFFDYEGQAANYSSDKVKELIDFFDDESDQGKLYVSYPMIEAFKDIRKHCSFKDHNVSKTITGSLYKPDVNDNTIYQDIRKIDNDGWKNIIHKHHKKAHFIVHDKYEIPNHYIEQRDIFDNQLIKFIEPHDKVAVLSAIPLFLINYFGSNLSEILQ